jgi:hypothetical protein
MAAGLLVDEARFSSQQERFMRALKGAANSSKYFVTQFAGSPYSEKLLPKTTPDGKRSSGSS